MAHARGSSRRVNSASGGTTPIGKQRYRPGAADSTMPASTALPSNASGALTLSQRRPTHTVTGPSAWENGRDKVAVAGGTRLGRLECG